jgi:hypothetical protein
VDLTAQDATTYYYRVVAVDGTGNRYPSSELVSTTLFVGSGTGLHGDYFLGTGLGGSPVVARVDPTVNFDWGGGSPEATIPLDNFSARWTGAVQAPATGDYVFSTNSDDGVRLWVDGRLLVDNWTIHGDTFNASVPIRLESGRKYEIKLEFFEAGGGALIRLHWTYPGQARVTIPQAQLYEAFP